MSTDVREPGAGAPDPGGQPGSTPSSEPQHSSASAPPAGAAPSPGRASSDAPPETMALESRDCAACGAPAEWNPAKQAMVCPFCGTVAPVEPDQAGVVREIDLVQTLRNLPAARRGWKGEKRSVRCRSCDAISVFDPDRAGQNCEFCGSPQIVDYDELKPPIRPEGLLPFKVSEESVRDAMRKWFKSKWLAPGKFKKKALIDTIKGLYVPYWTFDANADCPWQADSGTYYYTTQTYKDSKGRSRTRQVRHTRWRPASGRIEQAFDDELVPGTKGLNPELLRRIEPFPTGSSVPYDTSYLAGFTVEHYRVVLVEAAESARKQMHQKLRALCGAAVPGDTHRNLRIQPKFDTETFKLVLAPVWLLAYDYHGKSFQVMVNGVTGEIAGRYPKSWWKVALLVAAALIAITLFIFLQGG